ncbi:MAG TPA: hypothetical protein VGR46_13420 [Candidatus Limnocylindria bacterium]|jgi:hypothetical protein|nr:hypothetical protein [Candidatus Limnocylindria bacterium]
MRLVLALAVALAACGGEAARSSPPPSSAPPAASSAIPSIDVSDMMGAFPPTTFFVVRPGNVTALALLNHATKYTISIEAGEAQVATATQAGRVYVLDQTRAGARLRWFQIASGAEVRSQLIPGASVVPTGSGHGTLAFDASNGEVFALLREGSTMAIEEFEGFTLSLVKRRLSDLRCGERIVASAGRVVLACLGEGGLVLDTPAGGAKFSARTPLVAIAMSANGTLMAGAADGRLFRLAPGATDLETIETLRGRGMRVVADGIAAQADCCFVVGVSDRVANPRITVLADGLTVVSFPESSSPSGGILVQPPFAYYAVGKEARHIDLQQGFAEVMAGFSEGVLPGAVADR